MELSSSKDEAGSPTSLSFKRKKNKKDKLTQRLQAYEEQRKEIKDQLRNKYYWNNFVMAQSETPQDKNE